MLRTKIAVAVATVATGLASAGGAAACLPVELALHSDASGKRLLSAKKRQLPVIRTADTNACLIRTYLGLARICR